MTIFCVARNYAAHARELNNPVPEDPVLFIKPETALLTGNQPFHLPPHAQRVDYETEVVIRMSKGGRHIPESDASNCFDEVAVGIDFTARDVQQQCKEKGLPWEIAKAFDESAAVSAFYPKNAFGDFYHLGFDLQLNGEVVQTGNVDQMLFPVERLIAYISSIFTIRPGDFIFTGTPFGVRAVMAGDLLEASLAQRKLLTCEVRAPHGPHHHAGR